MSTPKVRTFADLTATLQSRASSIKAASHNKGAAENDPTPEKDQTEKGTVAIPRDPDADPAKQNTPGSTTNADTQKTLPAPAVAKTVEGAEKVANKDLSGKAASIADGIRKLAAGGLGKKAEVTQPNMPPNDKKNEGTDGGALKPPSGGAGAKNNPDPAVKDAGKGEGAGAMPADKTNAGAAAMPKADDKGPLPGADTKNTDTTKKAGMCSECKCDPCKCEPKSAGEIPFDASFHLKLASIILSTEEGRDFATAQIEKYHGAQAAQDIIKTASIMEQKADEMAAMEESGALMAEQMWKSASESERAGIIKLAEVLTAGRNQYRTEHEKMAYDAGAGGAAQMADAGMMGQEAPPAEGAEGAGGLQDQVVAALDQMVQSGEIDPETAAQVLQLLTQGEGADGAAGGAGGDPAAAMGGAGGDPAAAMAAMGGAGGGAAPAGGGGGAAPSGGGEGGGEGSEPKKKPEPDGDEEKEASVKSAANRAAVLKALKPKPKAA